MRWAASMGCICPPPARQYPSSSLNSSSERKNRSCTRFSSIPFAEPSLFFVLFDSKPDGTITLSRCHPPRFCEFIEELVVDDGIKTLGLHLRATCRGRSAAHFWKHVLDLHILCISRQSHPYKIMYSLCLLNPLR